MNCNINTQKNYRHWRKIIYCLQQQINKPKVTQQDNSYLEKRIHHDPNQKSKHTWPRLPLSFMSNAREFVGPHWLKLNHTVYYNWLNWKGEQMNSRGRKKMRKNRDTGIKQPCKKGCISYNIKTYSKPNIVLCVT